MRVTPIRRKLIAALSLLSAAVLLQGCKTQIASVLGPYIDIRGYRYCEILFSYGDVAEVWGTQGLNRCPADEWSELNPTLLMEQFGADGIFMNGPRFWVINGSSGAKLPGSETRLHGELEMRKLATLSFGGTPLPYNPMTVERTTTWIFKEGNEIYELSAPDGYVYVMQSYSQAIDSGVRETDLSSLGGRLDLPDGWTFSSHIVKQDFEMVADGEAVVLTDNLQNTYQRR